MEVRIEGGAPLVGSAEVPGDKSIAHRALLLGALAQGETVVISADAGEDNHTTARAVRQLGPAVEPREGGWRVVSDGPASWRSPDEDIDCGNSGTTMRLLAGMLSGARVRATLTGDSSLRRRPMGRISQPLRRLGAEIQGEVQDGREMSPLRIDGGGFQGGETTLEVASAQVKSALLLAGVSSGMAVSVVEPKPTRDHSERMLVAMGASLQQEPCQQGVRISLAAGAKLAGATIAVPGDFSSAAFLLAAGLLVPDSRVTVLHVGLNRTRTGLLEVLEEIGAKVGVSQWREQGGEPVGTLDVSPSSLHAVQAGGHPTVVGGATIPLLIDELVVLGAIGSQAEGCLEVRDASELRVKESDRVAETVRLLQAFGVKVEERADGFTVCGPQKIRAATLDVSSDHRIALTAAVLALAAEGESVLSGFEIARVSFPGLVDLLEKLGAKIR